MKIDPNTYDNLPKIKDTEMSKSAHLNEFDKHIYDLDVDIQTSQQQIEDTQMTPYSKNCTQSCRTCGIQCMTIRC